MWQNFGLLEKLVGRKVTIQSIETSLGRRHSSLGNVLKTEQQRNPSFPFEGLTKHMASNFEDWYKWLSEEHPEHAILPSPWNDALSMF